MRPDLLERLRQLLRRGVGGERLDHAARGFGAQVRGQLAEGLRAPGEERDGEVAVAGVGEGAGYAGALWGDVGVSVNVNVRWRGWKGECNGGNVRLRDRRRGGWRGRRGAWGFLFRMGGC